MSKDCIFCRIIHKEEPASIVWETDDSIAFLDTNPISDGHILLIPKRHVDYLYDVPEEQYNSLFRQVYENSQYITKAMAVCKLGIAVKGFEVAHAHIHLVPLSGPGQMKFDRDNCPSRDSLDRLAFTIAEQINRS